jgi:hypothetical protein
MASEELLYHLPATRSVHLCKTYRLFTDIFAEAIVWLFHLLKIREIKRLSLSARNPIIKQYIIFVVIHKDKSVASL